VAKLPPLHDLGAVNLPGELDVLVGETVVPSRSGAEIEAELEHRREIDPVTPYAGHDARLQRDCAARSARRTVVDAASGRSMPPNSRASVARPC
jgi:hypothetical protein